MNSYVRVFAPALALSGVQLGLSFGSFALVLLVLNVSGLGYAQIVDLVADVPLIGGAVSSIDPSWGNAAISLAVVEVINVPLLLPLAATATPAATDALSAKLTEWGFDAEGLNARLRPSWRRPHECPCLSTCLVRLLNRRSCTAREQSSFAGVMRMYVHVWICPLDLTWTSIEPSESSLTWRYMCS